MEHHRPHRREFLERAALGVAGLPWLGELAPARGEFAAELDRLQDGVSFAELRDAYTLDPAITYFNHASIGTVPRAVQDARARYLAVCESNPWRYLWGGAWEAAREQTRAKAAAALGCDAGDVALTHNTTEGFNVLASGLTLGEDDEVLFSSLNHPGASICWSHVAAVRGFTVRRFDFPVLDVPELTADRIVEIYAARIGERTRVLVLPHLDNLVGVRHPVKRLAALARERGVEFVAVDGAQVAGMLPVDVTDLGCDAYCTSPHKWLQAPKGVGLMYLRREARAAVRPMWVTWGQERWKGTVRVFEDYGTRNLPEVLALGDAIDFQRRLGERRKERRLRALWQRFRDEVDRTPELIWRSPRTWELAAPLFAIEVEGRDSSRVFTHMSEKHGFVFRPFRTQGLNTMRISPNVFATEAEVDRFFSVLRKEVV